jgi:hypothetical protein
VTTTTTTTSADRIANHRYRLPIVRELTPQEACRA